MSWTMSRQILGFVLAFYFSCYALAAGDFWRCENRVPPLGPTYGQEGDSCDVKSFGSPEYVQANYGSVIYAHTKSAEQEIPRYLNEIYAVVREASRAYLLRRNPQAAPAEIEAWQFAAECLVDLESLWTHYRTAKDDKLKMLRSDHGHGHGLMQVDDRTFQRELEAGAGWDIVKNLMTGFDEFYADWTLAANAKCVTDVGTFEARTRAAYSAYNGGEKKVCRWTNPNDRWAFVDKEFYRRYHEREWRTRIPDLNKRPAFDIACRIRGDANCSVVEPMQMSQNPNGTLAADMTVASAFEAKTDSLLSATFVESEPKSDFFTSAQAEAQRIQSADFRSAQSTIQPGLQSPFEAVRRVALRAFLATSANSETPSEHRKAALFSVMTQARSRETLEMAWPLIKNLILDPVSSKEVTGFLAVLLATGPIGISELLAQKIQKDSEQVIAPENRAAFENLLKDAKFRETTRGKIIERVLFNKDDSKTQSEN